MNPKRGLSLGGTRPIDGSGLTRSFELRTESLLTHGVIVGMTGSGKTDLLMCWSKKRFDPRCPSS